MSKKFFLLFAFLLGLDVLSKIGAIQSIPHLNYGPYPFGGVGVFSLGGITCSLNYIVNTGAAWGAFSGYPGFLFVLRCAILLGLFIFVPKRIPVWLVITGAIGNSIDYCLYGHVIDFLHFTFWGYSFPIFNVADSCITIGVVSLFAFPYQSKKIKAL